MGILVSKQCDKYVQKKCATYPDNKLTNIVETSLCCKARLLHYFDCSESVAHRTEDSTEEHDPFSSWCGWHNDHGSLTGLVSAMFIDKEGNPVDNTDPNAGRNLKTQIIIYFTLRLRSLLPKSSQ